MKYLFFFFLLLVFAYAPFAAQALETPDQAARRTLLQQIEILQIEIRHLQALLANLQSRQDITAASYLVQSLSDNSVLLEKNVRASHSVASVTKLMNAVVALEHIQDRQTITVTPAMLTPEGYSPSLFAGLAVGRDDLLKASLIQSTNDAAETLTYFIGKEKFLALMNQKAAELGMTNTAFRDAHGISLANRSTAADLAKLVAYIHEKHPVIWGTTKENNFWLPDAKGRSLKFQNMNSFYPLASFVGGKTGYLPQAKQTLASVFQVRSEPIAIILLASDNRQADIFSILNQLK